MEPFPSNKPKRSNLDGLHRQLAEVDENLCGTKLTPSERALFTARRKDIYLALHPETRATQNASLERKTSEKSAFVSDTADRTGTSRRTVEMEAARGAAIGDDVLAAVKGTCLDKGVELDALARMTADQQRDLAALERSTQEARWIELAAAKNKLAQLGPVSPKGGRGHEGGINAAVRDGVVKTRQEAPL